MTIETILVSIAMLIIEVLILGSLAWFAKDKINDIKTAVSNVQTLTTTMNNTLVRLATTDEEQSKTIESLSDEVNSVKKWVHILDTDVRILKSKLGD